MVHQYNVEAARASQLDASRRDSGLYRYYPAEASNASPQDRFYHSSPTADPLSYYVRAHNRESMSPPGFDLGFGDNQHNAAASHAVARDEDDEQEQEEEGEEADHRDSRPRNGQAARRGMRGRARGQRGHRASRG
jgi:hypothetical protein